MCVVLFLLLLLRWLLLTMPPEVVDALLTEDADAGGVGRKLVEVSMFSSLLGVESVDFIISDVGVGDLPRLLLLEDDIVCTQLWFACI